VNLLKLSGAVLSGMHIFLQTVVVLAKLLLSY